MLRNRESRILSVSLFCMLSFTSFHSAYGMLSTHTFVPSTPAGFESNRSQRGTALPLRSVSVLASSSLGSSGSGQISGPTRLPSEIRSELFSTDTVGSLPAPVVEAPRPPTDPNAWIKKAYQKRILAFTSEIQKNDDGTAVLLEEHPVIKIPKIITGELNRVVNVLTHSKTEMKFCSTNGKSCEAGFRLVDTAYVYPALTEFRDRHLGEPVMIQYSSHLEDPSNTYFYQYFGVDDSQTENNRRIPKDRDLFGDGDNLGTGFCAGTITGLFFRAENPHPAYVSTEFDGLIEMQIHHCYGYHKIDGSYIELPNSQGKIKYWKYSESSIIENKSKVDTEEKKEDRAEFKTTSEGVVMGIAVGSLPTAPPY